MRKINPFYLFVYTLIGIIVLYLFGWSQIYPKFTPQMIAMFLIIIPLYSLCGFLFNGMLMKNDINREKMNENLKFRFGWLTFFSFLGAIVEGIKSKGFPLLGAYSGNDYGIPTFHVILTVYTSFICLLIFQKIIQKTKRSRKKEIIYFFLNLFCLMLPLSRSAIIFTLLNCLWLFLFTRKNKLTAGKKITIGILIILSLYSFGIAGNYRSALQMNTTSALTDSSFIYRVGFVDKKFTETKLPGAFFWDYLYGTSSLANFQNITIRDKSDMNNSMTEFVATQYMPDVIGKRLYPQFYDEKDTTLVQYQITPILNVGTVFFTSFYLMHWYGVIMMISFIAFFPFCYIWLLRKITSKYLLLSLAVLNSMYVLNLFDNMFTFSVLSLQLMIPIILGIIERLKKE